MTALRHLKPFRRSRADRIAPVADIQIFLDAVMTTGGANGEMTDITIDVALILAALAASLVLVTKVALERIRPISYSGMIVFGGHVLGVRIMAPIALRHGEILGIVAFFWLVVAVLAITLRGARRIIIDGRTNPIGG